MQRELEKLTWRQMKELVPQKIDTLIFPVGTVEAHGVTALGTDNIIPVSMAHYLADRINALIAPVVNYGITRSLYGYPGSVTVSEESFRKYINDILVSFAHNGFRKTILLNGHGGNNAVLKEVSLNFHYQFKVKIAVIHWWELCRNTVVEFYGEAGGHAALDETALVQAVDPSLVDEKLYEEKMAYFVRAGADIYPIPGTILLYTKGEGYPRFDIDKAKKFQKKLFEEVEEFVKLILKNWESI